MTSIFQVIGIASFVLVLTKGDPDDANGNAFISNKCNQG
jgi:hypothetical protein